MRRRYQRQMAPLQLRASRKMKASGISSADSRSRQLSRVYAPTSIKMDATRNTISGARGADFQAKHASGCYRIILAQADARCVDGSGTASRKDARWVRIGGASLVSGRASGCQARDDDGTTSMPHGQFCIP